MMKQIFTKQYSKIDYILLLEKWYPFLISFIILILYVIIRPVLISDNLDSILNAIISFTSILLGFIGVLITLIFSLFNLSVVGDIFKDDFHRNLMHIYFKRCIQSGFMLIAFTILLFFRNTIGRYLNINLFRINLSIITFVKVGWVFLTPYFSLASYRIISLVLQAAFIPKQEEQSKSEEIENDYTELRKKYKNK